MLLYAIGDVTPAAAQRTWLAHRLSVSLPQSPTVFPSIPVPALERSTRHPPTACQNITWWLVLGETSSPTTTHAPTLRRIAPTPSSQNSFEFYSRMAVWSSGLGQDQPITQHPQAHSTDPLHPKTKVVVVTGIKKNSNSELRVRRG